MSADSVMNIVHTDTILRKPYLETIFTLKIMQNAVWS